MHSKEVILKKLSNYTPLKYNQFYWWRNWGPKNKPLFNSRPLLDRIKNGDLTSAFTIGKHYILN